MCWKSTRVCICWEVNRLAGWEWPSQQRFPQWDLASRMITHSHQIGLSCMEDPSPWRFILLHLLLLHTIRRSFVELDWRFSDICWGKKGGGREQMSSFQQKLALKGSETSIEHFAAVLKDVKDRGGWNTASALVRFHQQRKNRPTSASIYPPQAWILY